METNLSRRYEFKPVYPAAMRREVGSKKSPKRSLVKPYVCEYCGKRFRNPAARRLHLEENHAST